MRRASVSRSGVLFLEGFACREHCDPPSFQWTPTLLAPGTEHDNGQLYDTPDHAYFGPPNRDPIMLLSTTVTDRIPNLTVLSVLEIVHGFTHVGHISGPSEDQAELQNGIQLICVANYAGT